ncbi:c-type cytochrome [Alcanivorax sp.]|uniref:c-type cytochrome n=1 Tax=Alcanivorax sp. TaxID=1872427 RepID=UPI00258362BA|nr:c-type cytochrome [Alcanivorax sp.]
MNKQTDGTHPSVWTSIPFWRRSAAWVTGFAAILLIFLTFDTMSQIQMGSEADLEAGKVRRVPAPTVINHKIEYKMSRKRGHEVPVIGEQQPFFGKIWSPEDARALLHKGKVTVQAKNCMDCHTLLGNGAYYAPDLTKAWLDPAWQQGGVMQMLTRTHTTEEAMAKFLMDPPKYATHTRRMPDLAITRDEAVAIVAFLKHMSAIDTNGFPRNFSKPHQGEVTYAK